MSINRLGVDVGGVIIDRVNDNTDTSFFTENYLKTSMTSGVLEIIRTLNMEFQGRVCIVSKCGFKTQNKTLEYFRYHDFYGKTMIRPDQVFFCRERRDKAGICEKLGITHFVDDRLEVLSYLTSVENKYLFRPREEEVLVFQQYLEQVTRVESWTEVLDKIRQTF